MGKSGDLPYILIAFGMKNYFETKDTAMRLQGKVAIVTGAAGGIGRAIAIRFGREGARVAAVDVREVESLETVRLIEAAGGQAVAACVDVTDGAQVQTMVEAVLARWDRIDILVNDAGICPFEQFLDMSEALWDQVLDTNLKGYFLVSQAVAKAMVERGTRGRIIAVSSISAEFGGSQQAHYCASKAGINLLVKVHGHLAGAPRHYLQRRSARHGRDRHQPHRPGRPNDTRLLVAARAAGPLRSAGGHCRPGSLLRH